jgi:phosphoribosylformylglycinamidine cyclo-ligase
MGIGMCIVAPRASIESITSVFEMYRMRALNVGIIEKPGSGQVSCEVENKHTML